MWRTRSSANSSRVMATTGVPKIIIKLVAYWAHIKSGRRNQVMPGARILCTVVRKFTPVRMEENPLIKTPAKARVT